MKNLNPRRRMREKNPKREELRPEGNEGRSHVNTWGVFQANELETRRLQGMNLTGKLIKKQRG